MCTLAAWISVFPDAPLVVAANRDESLGRPSTGPMIWPGSPRFVAPRDEVAGGSWWALNEYGVFVGITNRSGAGGEPERRSRGLLVTDLARISSVEEASRRLQSLDPRDYNGFHLLICDGSSGVRAVADGDQLAIERLGPGFHLLTERSFGAAEVHRDDVVATALGGINPETLDEEAIGQALALHGEHPLLSLCVHLDELGYGTRSSALIVRRNSAPDTLLYAEGAPCRTPYVDRSELLSALLRR